MSPMIASARLNRPPAPMPWTPRKIASHVIEAAKAHRTEPITKIVIAARKNGLRP